ncbi:MAG TPA: PIN domain-containing protein [Longimicrobium sp.]|jgi:predicted nucleic acid-binding protein|uniref:PIN domain-containing protein n=1 Tax=Longimicrobium sp. TaxID=2029185 RepID=UPI002EDB3B9C
MNAAAVRAVLDATVLYAAAPRDLFIHVAREGLLLPHWSEHIHAEWTRNLLRNRPDLDPARLNRTVRLMEAAVPGALVEGYERRIATLHLPDPGDRHVLAVAVHSGASTIVTFNQRDFPAHCTEPLGVRVTGPDEFASELIADNPERFCVAAARHRAALRRPPATVPEYLDNLRSAGLVQTALGLACAVATREGTL